MNPRATNAGFRAPQRGSTAVEFAMIAVVLVTILMASIEFGRWMTTLEMASNATRSGARMAAVCDLGDAEIKGRMQALIPQLSLGSAQIAVDYFPAGCTRASCQSVRVGLSGATFSPAIPFLSGAFPIPPFATSLPRESMESANAAGEANPTCNCGTSGGPVCL